MNSINIDKVLDTYFKKGGDISCCPLLVKHQIDTFNEFLDKKLNEIIVGFNPIKVINNWNNDIQDYEQKIQLFIEDPHYTKPSYKKQDGTQITMTPHMARIDNLTYSSDLYVNVRVVTDIYNEIEKNTETKEKRIDHIFIGKLPIMVGSKACILSMLPIVGQTECHYEMGGYFIVNGNEKVLINQDKIKENYVLIFKPNNVDIMHAEIRSSIDNMHSPPKTCSLSMSTKANYMGRIIRLTTSFLKTDIPVFIIFRALGFLSDEEIIYHILYDIESELQSILLCELKACCDDACGIYTKEDAQNLIIKNLNGSIKIPKTILTLEYHFKNDLLPHVNGYKHKALYIGHMIKKMLMIYLGYEKYDNRDSYMNKRIDSPGILMANLFRQCYGKMTKDMKQTIEKDINLWRSNNSSIADTVSNKSQIIKYFRQSLLDSWLKYALSTGNWGIKSIGSFQNIKQGVSQVLSRMSFHSTLSHLRRINTAMEKNGKLVQPRKLHNSHHGMICPAECFDPNTLILLWDGTIKKAKDIIIGDYLIDDKGNSVKVQTTCSGHKTMYEVIQNKNNFVNYTVTDNHILTLKVKKHKNSRNHRGKIEFMWFNKKELKYKYKTIENITDLNEFASSIDDDDVIDITIEKYLSLPKNVQKQLYTFKSDGINWQTKKVALDPYIFGMWLGDGFITTDKELLDKWGIQCTKLLAKYDLVNNKHIPLDYLTNDRKTRLAVLAGLIDTDGNVRANGHEIRISQYEPNYKIIYDTEFLARSLGFSCHVNDGTCSYTVKDCKKYKPYKELTITGKYLYEIPTVLPRKKLNKCNNLTHEKKCSSFLQSSFELVKKDIQPYVGWQVEGNGRFLLGDMSVTHNTPEGAPVGLVKNMALSTNISVHMNSCYIRELLVKHGVKVYNNHTFETNIEFMKNMGKKENIIVMINGEVLGYHENPIELFKTFKRFKRIGYIYPMTAIVWNIHNHLFTISTEAGRMFRPLFIVDKGNKLRMNTLLERFPDMLDESHSFESFLFPSINSYNEEEGFIEYMDLDELNYAMVAMFPEDLDKGSKGSALPPSYTHCEIHPALMNGVLGINVPFSNYNQSPRNTYQCAMGKQALGVYMSNYDNRMDTVSNILNYPQKPLVKTQLSKYTYTDELPSGINAIVAIMSYTGFNQEDSVMINQDAIERGLFVSTHYKTIKEQCSKNHSTGEEEIFTKPENENNKSFNYTKLDTDGLVKENTYVEGGDIIVGKIMPKKYNGKIENIDCSVSMKPNEFGYVDKNYININNEGYKFCKVRVRNYRKPEIGDKLACFSPDHQYLTTDGWIPVADLTLDHYLATLDENGELKYQQPIKLHEFDHKGKMFSLNSNQVNLLTTPNHRMLVRGKNANSKWNKKTAEEIYHTRYKMKKDADIWKPDYTKMPKEIAKYFIIKDTLGGDSIITHFKLDGCIIKYDKCTKKYEDLIIDIDDWLMIYGIYIAEGSICGKSITSIAANKPRVQEVLDKIALKKQVKITSVLDKGELVKRHICSKLITLHLDEEHLIAIYKYLKPWVWWLNREQSKTLIHAMCLGDGCFSGNSARYYTSSTKLANDLQRLCLHAGYSSNKALKTPKGTRNLSLEKLNKEKKEASGQKDVTNVESYTNADYWNLSIIKAQNEPVINKNIVAEKHIKYSENVYQDEWIDYDGKVYCCTVKNDAAIYMRREGVVVWTKQSRSAQKGTIGMSYRQQDMPFTKDGIVPDIIMNPHAIPSRMTIGQLMECLLGKAVCMTGQIGDCTPFNGTQVQDISKMLEDLGMEKHGNEILYDGRSGRQIKTEIFIGPTYYQRLKHMVMDKIHTRGSNGPIVLLTRQPSEGRSRNGGLRLGEMERDAIISHGTSTFLKERMLDVSDASRQYVCKTCGILCISNPEKKIYKCVNCKNNADIAQIRIPYAFKLLSQELSSMNVTLRFTI